MNIKVRITLNFKKETNRLIKKYPSLVEDLSILQDTLLKNPKLGIPLGLNCFKIRLKSKRKGKSGGARIISFVESTIVSKIISKQNEITVYLISIYDKSEIDTISNEELKKLIKRKLN